LDKPEGRRRVGRPNPGWMDGVMRDADRLGIRNSIILQSMNIIQEVNMTYIFNFVIHLCFKRV
jgi:hypothetical protein